MLLSCPELPAQEPSARSSYFFRDAVGGGHPTTALLTEIAEERSRFHRHRPRADLHPWHYRLRLQLHDVSAVYCRENRDAECFPAAGLPQRCRRDFDGARTIADTRCSASRTLTDAPTRLLSEYSTRYQ